MVPIVGKQENLRVVLLSQGLALLSCHETYLCNQGNSMIWNRKKASTWETFELRRLLVLTTCKECAQKKPMEFICFM